MSSRGHCGIGDNTSTAVRSLRVLVAVLAILAVAQQAHASRRRRHHHHYRHHRVYRSPAAPPYHAAILEEASSGTVLFERQPDLEWPPASMTKLMLLLVTEDAIHAGRISPSKLVRVSSNAAATKGSRIGLTAGRLYSLSDLMKAALIRSANDAAVAVAEAVCGSVEACVARMNRRAQQLGMTHTHFGTVNGLPPIPHHDVDSTSARDMARLAREVIQTTDLLKWSSLEETPFDHGEMMLHNTNHLVSSFDGCDGLKTGFTFSAGFNLTATAKRGDLRLIAVVLGAPSNRERFHQAARLLQWGFGHYTMVKVLSPGQELPVAVQLDSGRSVHPVVKEATSVVVLKSRTNHLQLDYLMPTRLSHPLPSGTPVGEVVVLDGDRVLTRIPALWPTSFDDLTDSDDFPATKDTSTSTSEAKP